MYARKPLEAGAVLLPGTDFLAAAERWRKAFICVDWVGVKKTKHKKIPFAERGTRDVSIPSVVVDLPYAESET